MEKLIIYQAFPRIFTNTVSDPVPDGTFERNGCGKLNDLSTKLLKSLRKMGVNCLWLTGIIEMATKTAFDDGKIPADNPNVVKGQAGSPYAIKDYYDVAPSLASNVKLRMKEFEAVVKRAHRTGLKLIIDFVPNHTARVYHSDSAPVGIEDFGQADDFSKFFSPSNNYYYITNQRFAPCFDIESEGPEPYVEFPAKATGNDCYNAFCGKNDWYETVKLNYGFDPGDWSTHFDPIPDTWLKMLHILRFWAAKGVDGFRCDMVFMVPLPFWHWAIPQVKAVYPHLIFIGEIYDVGLYRPFLDYGCFDYLYDKVNLYDTLVEIEKHGWSAAQLTGCWQTVDGIGDRMLNFLENHDEVRFGSYAYAGDSLRVIPSLVTSAMISNGPFLLYYGQELGEQARDNEGFAGDNNRTTIFDYWSISTVRRWYNKGKCNQDLLSAHERWLRNVYKNVFTLCNSRPALHEGGFFDLMYVNFRTPGFNPHSNFAFIRYKDDDVILIIVNFSREACHVSLVIPDIAFEMTGMRRGEVISTDLLWGKPHKLMLSSTEPLTVYMSGGDAVVLPVGREKIGSENDLAEVQLREEK